MTDVMTKRFMDKYGRSGSCGDELAESLSTFLTDPDTGKTNRENFLLICTSNRVNHKRWSHLNQGQQRMLLGNVLRGKLRRGVDVNIGDAIIKGLTAK